MQKSMGAASLHKSMDATSLQESTDTPSLYRSMGAASLNKSVNAGSSHRLASPIRQRHVGPSQCGALSRSLMAASETERHCSASAGEDSAGSGGPRARWDAGAWRPTPGDKAFSRGDQLFQVEHGNQCLCLVQLEMTRHRVWRITRLVTRRIPAAGRRDPPPAARLRRIT